MLIKHIASVNQTILISKSQKT